MKYQIFWGKKILKVILKVTYNWFINTATQHSEAFLKHNVYSSVIIKKFFLL